MVNMNGLYDIIRKRSTPGVLIFDSEERLLYSNDEVLELLPCLRIVDCVSGDMHDVLVEIHKLCRQVVDGSDPGCATPGGPAYAVVSNNMGHDLSLRAVQIGYRGGEEKLIHIMILVDRITEKRNIDFGRAREMFNLSSRELDVLRHVCMGSSNKTISEEMFICEYTVKDHIKNIMKKMNAGSRSEIIAKLK